MPVPRAFLKLAVPAVAAQLINILYNLVDKMFIGHIPEVGKQALAGVGVTTPVILAISAFAALVSMGGAPKASIFLGKGENHQAEKVLGSCTWMLLLLSVLITAVMLTFGRPVLLLFGASTETIGFATDYMNIYLPGHCFYAAYPGIERFYHRSGENPGQYAQCCHRRCDKYRSGCFVDQRLSDGCPRCRPCYRDFSGPIYIFCDLLSVFRKERAAVETEDDPL